MQVRVSGDKGGPQLASHLVPRWHYSRLLGPYFPEATLLSVPAPRTHRSC